MKAPLARSACTALLLGVLTAAFVPSEALEPARLSPDELSWIATPTGVSIAKLAGDDKAAGMYAVRYRFPANFKVQPHFHPDDRLVVVLYGTLHVG